MLAAVTADLVWALTWVLDEPPVDKEVKAGWTAFVLFLLLIAAVVLLGFSLTKHLRKAEAARKAGVYGPVDDDQPDEPAEPPKTP
jgi:drug/metabolite transporter (DMT)-like permease